ncbi:MAG TPA: SIMPL domain-containing protein [Amaricoccus sp.]|nr:SIMPL domain-containing protein [Amaricoccus sp.]
MRTAALATLLLALAGAAAAEDVGRRITVTGAAEAEAVPDLATVTAGVSTRADTAETALATNAETMTAVLAALDAAGIERRDVQTSQLSLGPLYASDAESDAPPAVVAYEASNLVTVRVRAIDGLGAAIDALAKAGANQLQSLSFDVSDPKPALDTARKQAVADARARAELYAAAAGVTLGPVLSISETTQSPGPIMMRAAAEAAPPIAAGTVSVGAQVEVVYAIE